MTGASKSRVRPSPNIWNTPELYELENRAADPHGRIAAAPVAVGEIRAAAQVSGAQAAVQHLGDEALGVEAREGTVERQFVQDGDAQRLQRRRALVGQGQLERRVVRAEVLARVRLERQHRERPVRTRPVRRAQHVGVAEMHPVEVAERDGRAAGCSRQAAPIAETLHQAGAGNRTIASPSITTLPATVQVVRSVARRLPASQVRASAVAVTVSPIRTGARNFRVWPR